MDNNLSTVAKTVAEKTPKTVAKTAKENTLQTIIEFGRRWVEAEGKAETTRIAFIDSLAAAGFTYANTAAYTDKALRENKISNEVKVHRDQLLLICAASIKIKGRRLSEEDLVKFSDDGVSHKVLLSGAPKGGSGVSWNGDASSKLNKVRLALKAFEDSKAVATSEAKSGTAGKAKTTTAKKRGARTTTAPASDMHVILDHLQQIYAKTFKEDINLKCDLMVFQQDLRKLAKAIGGALVTPKQK